MREALRNSGIRKKQFRFLPAFAIYPFVICQSLAGESAFHMHTPMIEQGSWGAELVNAYQMGLPNKTLGKETNINLGNQFKVHGDITNYWAAEISADFEHSIGDNYNLNILEFVNIVRFDKWTPRFFDAALYATLTVGVDEEATNGFEIGPIAALTTGPWMLVVNPFFEKTFGKNSIEGVVFHYGWRATYSFAPMWGLGIEGYGTIISIGDSDFETEQLHRLGPVVYLGPIPGRPLYGGQQPNRDNTQNHLTFLKDVPVEWGSQIGVLFGLTNQTADTALMFNITSNY